MKAKVLSLFGRWGHLHLRLANINEISRLTSDTSDSDMSKQILTAASLSVAKQVIDNGLTRDSAFVNLQNLLMIELG